MCIWLGFDSTLVGFSPHRISRAPHRKCDRRAWVQLLQQLKSQAENAAKRRTNKTTRHRWAEMGEKGDCWWLNVVESERLGGDQKAVVVGAAWKKINRNVDPYWVFAASVQAKPSERRRTYREDKVDSFTTGARASSPQKEKLNRLSMYLYNVIYCRRSRSQYGSNRQ